MLSVEATHLALQALSVELGKRGITGEACLFGGTVMVLAFKARPATKDVDAVFQPTEVIRRLARHVGDELHLPADWLNEGVKGFLSSRHDITTGNLPQFPNLRLTMPVPEYLLAMKCMAARLGGSQNEPSDVADIILLIRHLKLSSAMVVLDLVSPYYPPDRIPVKNQFLVEGLFEEGRI